MEGAMVHVIFWQICMLQQPRMLVMKVLKH
jgi:hypothetical protein